MGIGSFFKKLQDGLSKTRQTIVDRVQQILTTRTTLDASTIDEIEEVLLEADVGVATTSLIVDQLRERVKASGITTPADALPLLADVIAETITRGAPAAATLLPATPRPYVILVVGVNGAGKTTTVGKLAHLFRREGLKVLIGAADTFRAAANEQLEIWAQRAGVEIVQQGAGADPASVAFDTVSAAISRGMDVVLLDTAGRLHTKGHLMEELKKIHRVLGKRLPEAPHDVLLVLDGTTGQNGLQQAREFGAAAGVTGLVVTKLDGTAKGGVVIGVVAEHQVPVRFIGVGEGIDDLQLFDARQFADALLSRPGPATE
ncbi:MAG: signal recognition particle-docking protein FtsY [Bacteroidetes bacterium]|jgi:fused signal recognition particle receptor|nr:signal recognition particle-docking protein FtsY [Bacteroidota bacterium]